MIIIYENLVQLTIKLLEKFLRDDKLHVSWSIAKKMEYFNVLKDEIYVFQRKSN